jgi:hypothetical protein
MLPIPDVVAFAALSDEAIGLSIGDGEEARLPAYLEEDAGPAGTFMSMGYDMAAYLEYSHKVKQQVKQAQDVSVELDPEQEAVMQSIEDISTSARQAIMSFSDRNYTTFRLTPEGFEADTRMTFK